MSRTGLITSFTLVTAAYLGYNFLHHIGQFDPNTGQEVLLVAHTLPLYVLGAALLAIYLLCGLNIVDQWNRRPVMCFGKYVRTLGPGISWIEPFSHNTLDDVNIQDTVIEVKVDEVQTKNNVGVALKGVLTYCIEETSVKDAVLNVDDVYASVDLRALSTLTDVAGMTDLDGFLEHRDTFCASIADKLGGRVSTWGVKVKAFELKGFSINDTVIAEAIAMKARAEKEGAAEVTRAQLQKQVAEALNVAAATFDEKGRWLKGIETLIELCRSGQNNTILVPTDLTEPLARMASFPKLSS